MTYQEPSRAPEHSRFDVRHINNKRKLKAQDARTYLNSKRVGKQILDESYHNPLCQGEYGRVEPHSAPVIFKTLVSARILSVPNLNKVKVR